MQPCAEVGCSALVDRGRCSVHVREREQRRGSSTKRGYDARWQSVRLAKLMNNPLCEDCANAGRTTPASEVHHVRKVKDAPHLRLHMDNLMSLCQSCHSRRTLRGE